MSPLRSTIRATAAVLTVLLVGSACTDASDVVLLEIEGAGVLFGQVFLDADASGNLSLGDTPVSGVDVVLLASATRQVAGSATSDSAGVYRLLDVPVGSYLLALDSAALGDSLSLLAEPQTTVALGDTTLVNIGASFPVLSLEEALAGTIGNRVFTTGIALNPRVNFDPTGQVHFAGDSLFLRALNVARVGIGTGDSVRVFGRLISDNGRVALDSVTPVPLVSQLQIVSPIDVSAAEGATAGGGPLDAALARIEDLEITDTMTAADGHFRFWGVDGNDSIEVVLRSFMGFNPTVTAQVRPDTTVRVDRVIGLLTPFDDGGGVRWRLLPRDPQDLLLELRLADVAVTAAFDTTRASLGDVVDVTVVASNSGPLTATALAVRDTIPTPFAYVSSSATTGTYDPGTGRWTIGDLASGAADTLVISMEVIDGTPLTVANVAESLGSLLEVDPNAGNDGIVVFLTIF